MILEEEPNVDWKDTKKQENGKEIEITFQKLFYLLLGICVTKLRLCSACRCNVGRHISKSGYKRWEKILWVPDRLIHPLLPVCATEILESRHKTDLKGDLQF